MFDVKEERCALLPRVEAAARRAFDANETAEYNLMAWMHSHLQGLAKLAEGAPELGLSDDARAIVTEIKELL